MTAARTSDRAPKASPNREKVCSSICFAVIAHSTVWPTRLHVPAFVVGSCSMSNSSVAGQFDACCRHRSDSGGAVAHRCRRAGPAAMSEYEDRLTKAYAAQTFDELDRLSADLPGTATTPPRRSARAGRRRRPLLLAIMSGFERRGRWNVPKRIDVLRAVWRRRDRSALRRLHRHPTWRSTRTRSSAARPSCCRPR